MKGIYKITNPEGSVYIGQTHNWNKRLQQYKALDCKRQSRLYLSLAKYGWSNHTFEIVYEFPNDVQQCILDTYEILFVSQYKSNVLKYPESNGLNLTDGGRGTTGFNSSDRKGERTNTLKGLPKSDSHKEAIRKGLLGRKQTQEHKDNAIKARMKCL